MGLHHHSPKASPNVAMTIAGVQKMSIAMSIALSV
jgi:hypothetical protein